MKRLELMKRPGTGLGGYPEPKKSTGRHTIEDIDYSEDYIECDCGWKGAVDDFQPHRKEVLGASATR